MGQWVQDKKVRSCERIATEVRVSRTRDPQLIRYIYTAIGAEWQPKQGGICGAESLRGRACLLTLAMLAHHHWRLRRTITLISQSASSQSSSCALEFYNSSIDSLGTTESV